MNMVYVIGLTPPEKGNGIRVWGSFFIGMTLMHNKRAVEGLKGYTPYEAMECTGFFFGCTE